MIQKLRKVVSFYLFWLFTAHIILVIEGTIDECDNSDDIYREPQINVTICGKKSGYMNMTWSGCCVIDEQHSIGGLKQDGSFLSFGGAPWKCALLKNISTDVYKIRKPSEKKHQSQVKVSLSRSNENNEIATNMNGEDIVLDSLEFGSYRPVDGDGELRIGTTYQGRNGMGGHLALQIDDRLSFDGRILMPFPYDLLAQDITCTISNYCKIHFHNTYSECNYSKE